MYKQKRVANSPIGIFLITVRITESLDPSARHQISQTSPHATKSLKPLPSPKLSNLVT